ncbi:hypothetical protein KB206_08490 [Microvirga sp. STS02]|uniref:DUF6438 domain-containing protein n=1 Tax=Hymenobacter negativus TaxID=2795026 RepID=UPI0018DD8689|nr:MULTISPECIES: DUF6438 domain-containing protein [Bacteria]MBH8568916.1 hypothetical protein [Hymenobacter negativus]MBR7208651.1 hypothetical protein [Microvirga sp. STS02]
MRLLSLLLLLGFFSFSFVLPANAQYAPTKKVKVKKASKKTVATTKAAMPTAAGPVLTFERTPCYGFCPAYIMEVYADGRVAYEGRHSVPMMGKHELKMPAAAVADMLRQAREARFETFEKNYSSGATDLPSTIVTIRQPDGTLKKVTVEANAPENVKSYFTYLTTQFDQLAQVNGLEK